ncbi:MAG: LysR family transcriptional regulator [Parvularculaceae bacterium]|nr:LysR family transcriptional regulator [Parvularculaceae bacterium]
MATTNDFDWNQARAFLATVEAGSLSAAAKALGLTQPTLSRQVAALEADLGVTLFERGPRTMMLTAAGRRLAEHVGTMSDAANKVALTASGQAQDVEGEVTVTATNGVATYHLPRVLAKVRAIAPRLRIHVVASNDIRDLTRREADIAIRHARPTQSELIAKLIGETTAHIYASSDYLDRMGRPSSVEDLAQLDVIGFGRAEVLQMQLDMFSIPLKADNCSITTESSTTIFECVRQGMGSLC